MNKSQSVWLTGIALAGIIFLAGYWWLNRGYGEVSPVTYEYSKALYSACLNQSEVQLNKVEVMLSEADEVPKREQAWLNDIIAKAKNGNWTSASRNARRMLEDQVQY